MSAATSSAQSLSRMRRRERMPRAWPRRSGAMTWNSRLSASKVRNQLSPPLAMNPCRSTRVGAPGGPATSRMKVVPRPGSGTRRPSGTAGPIRPSSRTTGRGTASPTKSRIRSEAVPCMCPPEPHARSPSCHGSRPSTTDRHASMSGALVGHGKVTGGSFKGTISRSTHTASANAGPASSKAARPDPDRSKWKVA